MPVCISTATWANYGFDLSKLTDYKFWIALPGTFPDLLLCQRAVAVQL